ncbi:hypothetical protein LSAT2_026796 [Lamellibrachia satsuma]|nr:hypothetical protein LSAT2_026796 [Lamellibrachia satsuma]
MNDRLHLQVGRPYCVRAMNDQFDLQDGRPYGVSAVNDQLHPQVGRPYGVRTMNDQFHLQVGCPYGVRTMNDQFHLQVGCPYGVSAMNDRLHLQVGRPYGVSTINDRLHLQDGRPDGVSAVNDQLHLQVGRPYGVSIVNDQLHLLVERPYGVSAMNDRLHLQVGRPYGGIGVLWRKTISHACTIFDLQDVSGLIGGGYNREETEDIKQSMENEYNELGPITFAEVAVTCHGVLLLLLWASREPKIAITWSSLYGAKYWYITDSASAVLIGICLFAFPSQQPVCCQRGTEPQEPVSFPGLLDWPTVHAKMPWGMLLVVGSGYAIAKGIKVSGLDEVIGLWMLDVSGQSPSIVVFVVCLLATMMTQVTSNADTSRIILPQLEALTNHMKVNPLRMMVPSVQCCSYGFLLPVSTSTNAIVYAFGRIDLVDMFYVVFLFTSCLVTGKGIEMKRKVSGDKKSAEEDSADRDNKSADEDSGDEKSADEDSQEEKRGDENSRACDIISKLPAPEYVMVGLQLLIKFDLTKAKKLFKQ